MMMAKVACSSSVKEYVSYHQEECQLWLHQINWLFTSLPRFSGWHYYWWHEDFNS
jgi:hypothetical protein